MIQAKDELILGIDLNSEYAQVTYWHQSVREPETLGVRDGTQQLPAGIAWMENEAQEAGTNVSSGEAQEADMNVSSGEAQEADTNAPSDRVWHPGDAGYGVWSFWDGTAESPYIDRVFEKIENGDPLKIGGMVFEPDEMLAVYLRLCIADLKLLTDHTVLHVMVTVRKLDEALNQVIVSALQRLGVDRKRIYVQDFLSSFYYYAINQKKELWMQDVALIAYEPEKRTGDASELSPQNSADAAAVSGQDSGEVSGYVLHIDWSTKPAIAVVDLIASQPMTEEVRAGRSDADWKKEKDRLFFELLKKVFERRKVSVSYLMGDYFNKSWATRSIQFLCTGRRAWQGMNLYSKGACYAAMERAGIIPPREILYGGLDMIDRNIGMEMRIRGKDSWYPLVNAGVNWYEAHHVCEFILHGEREIRLISRPMDPMGDPIEHTMRLPGLPKRPDRATRLRLTVYFSSPSHCHIDVEDLGFGGLYKSSGMSWSREIRF